ncbi:GDSL-type esterase/lipase family protein [uncultured Sphingomonas sp.]|uniref:GDSL-type esterase/lipase family protein n=1 Tax=uncultured Sphingomonas sp. TaxID=158754 RepID=UPI0025D1D8C3|nr:GDSL-type esterase/lipase family protein [uncultured Sphingomonas sp.]
MSIVAAAALGASACIGSLCQPGALHPYFDKLARLQAGTGRPVHILQVGDSHSAGDAITGAWREMLQGRYGGGGRGVLPPGRPYDGYITRGVQVAMSPGWRIASDFGANWSTGNPPLGLSAFSLTSQQDGATMSVQADPYQAFDRFTVCAIARPGSGNLLLRAATASITFDLSSVTIRPECRTVSLDAPTTGADLTVQGGPVTITSWGTFRSDKGVTVSNLGVVGSQLVHFARTDDAVITEELRAYRPDLIVVAFGTNEGFAPRFNTFEYEVTLRTQIGRLRRIAGNVPILLLGAPDALSRRDAVRGNMAGQPAAYCGTVSAPVSAPQPSVIGSIMDRLRNSVGAGDAPAEAAPAAPRPPASTGESGASRGPLFPPAALQGVRDVQRRVAAQLNVGYWDWERAMGGRCSADQWVHASPALMRGDYVHYTSAGGHELAKRLQGDLDAAARR